MSRPAFGMSRAIDFDKILSQCSASTANPLEQGTVTPPFIHPHHLVSSLEGVGGSRIAIKSFWCEMQPPKIARSWNYWKKGYYWK